MVGISNGVTLTAAVRSQLMAMQSTGRALDITTQKLATGRKVNSAIDDAQNFFVALSVSNTAKDSERLISALRQNVQVIKTALTGIDTIQQLLQQAEALTLEALETSSTLSAITPVPLQTQILADNPVTYWQLNEAGGGTAGNQGSGGPNGGYSGGVSLGQAPLYTGGGTSADFNGVNQFVNIPNSPLINTAIHDERTIELVFNADTVAGRQVLYEEGGTTNGLNLYIDNGRIYYNGRDGGDWGPFNISAPIVAGQTYHAVLQLDQPNGELRGYLDGNLVGSGAVTVPLSAHTAAVAIGGMRGGAWYHNGSQAGNGNYFNGRISDVALYNAIVSEASIADKAAVATGNIPTQIEADVTEILNQIDLSGIASHYRGTNLLTGDLMTSVFNASGTSTLDTQGQDLSTTGLGIDPPTFDNIADIQATLDQIRAALTTVRAFERTLTTSLNVIQTRDTFLSNISNINQEGADKLTLADQNEESAKLLTLQTRRDIQINVLSETADSDLAQILFRR